MKIALVRQKYTEFGGAERYVSGLASMLLKHGHDVHVLARKWEAAENTGITFHRIKSSGGPAFLRQPSFARAAASVVEKGGFDLVHSFDRTYSQDIYRAGDGCHVEWLSRRARAQGGFQAFIDKHNPRHKAFLDLERRLFSDPRLKIVMVNSQLGRKEILDHYNLPEEKVRVLYNGLDKVKFNPALRDAHRAAVRKELCLEIDDPVVLFVGSGFLRKGLTETIKALQYFKGTLLVAGKDGKEPFLRLAKRVGVTERVVFLGPRSDVPRLYGAADVFALPSWYEPFSNACLEAMASGLPVVTTDETGAAEAIREGENGCTVSFPTDPEELGEKLNRAAEIELETIVETNSKILDLFDWEKTTAQTLSAYSEILDAHQTRPGG